MGLVPWLLPFVWVLQVDSCGGVVQETPLTGLELVSKFDADAWGLVASAIAVSVLAPFVAVLVQRPARRVVVHLLGAVGALFSLYLAVLLMLFAIFDEKRLHGAGWAVAALFTGASADAVWRVWHSVREWRAAQQLQPGGAP
jgi:urea transporter